MNKALLSILLFCLLAFSGCGESSTRSTPSPCDAFIGTWKGKYDCIVDDEMIIENGKSEYDVVITLHANFINPDKANGKLVASDRIEVPEQSMGGRPGTAVITLVDGKLQLKQSGLMMTVEGKDYIHTDQLEQLAAAMVLPESPHFTIVPSEGIESYDFRWNEEGSVTVYKVMGASFPHIIMRSARVYFIKGSELLPHGLYDLSYTNLPSSSWQDIQECLWESFGQTLWRQHFHN